jgi:hypothetical protein
VQLLRPDAGARCELIPSDWQVWNNQEMAAAQETAEAIMEPGLVC